MFAALYSPRVEDAPALLVAAQACSPRIEQQLGGRLVLIDAAGLTRIVGDAEAIARELRPQREAPGAPPRATVHVAVAPARLAALLLAVAQPYSVVRPGQTAAAVGALPLDVFETLAGKGNARKGDSHTFHGDRGKSVTVPLSRVCPLCRLAGARACGQPGGACTELPTLRRWGLATLGDLAALPPADLAARLGQAGVALQRLARGLDTQPLVPVVDEARFEASFDLEWPVEALQPLSFVLTRVLDPLSAALERADRGAAAIETTLTLVSAHDGADGARVRDTHVRRLELPAPMRDARVLRTLVLLDLESHPPSAGIDRVSVRLEPTPARIVQFSLLERAGPQPETIATLTSRLVALVGEGRIGSPALLDTHRPDGFEMRRFGDFANSRSGDLEPIATSPHRDIARSPTPVLRRFRLPVAARVVVEHDRLMHVTTDRIGIRGGAVQQWAGPWRGSGGWWTLPCGGAEGAEARSEAETAWDRDEYDVVLADGGAYRVCRDRHEDRWFIEGMLD